MSQSFSTRGVSAPVVKALDRRGITPPFAIQSLVLPDALAGVDILAVRELAGTLGHADAFAASGGSLPARRQSAGRRRRRGGRA